MVSESEIGMGNDQQRKREELTKNLHEYGISLETRMEVSRRIVAISAFGGYFMLALGAVLVVGIAINSIFFRYHSPSAPGTDEVISWVIQWYTSELLSLIGALVLLFVGLRVLTTSGKRVRSNSM